MSANLIVRDRSGQAVELVANIAAASADESAASSVAKAEVDLTLDLLRTMESGSATNVLMSPSSLAVALAMLNFGARDKTQEQISRLLGPSGASADDIAHGWSTLVSDWISAAAQNAITLSSANSVWLQHGAPLVASFTDALARYFRSGVWQVDFMSDPDAAVRDLNAWVSRQTRGHIPELLTADDVEGLLLVLVNALYLQADWAEPFDTRTDPKQFTTASGRTRFVDMMTTIGSPQTYNGDDVDAAQVPFRGGRFAALLVEPKTTDLNNYVKSLNRDALSTLVDHLGANGTLVSMPTLQFKSTTDLKPPLQKLGMTDAFESGRANLSGLSPQADYVAFVKQKATMNVTPTGVTATAATAIGVYPLSAHFVPKSLAFDHPFLFLIRDVETGAIMFAAEINDPSTH